MSLHNQPLPQTEISNRLSFWHLSIAVICTLIIFSCKDDSVKKEIPTQGDVKLLGVVTERDSSKTILIVLRRIIKVVKYDSVKKKDYISYDTIVGRPISVPEVDSLGHAIFGADGKPKVKPNPEYISFSKDSVSFKVENISVDSLLKKNNH